MPTLDKSYGSCKTEAIACAVLLIIIWPGFFLAPFALLWKFVINLKLTFQQISHCQFSYITILIKITKLALPKFSF